MTRRCVLRRCAALTLLTLLAGCQFFKNDEPRIDRSSGPLAEMRYQWTASPGIDLLTGPGVPIRAFMESRLDAQTMGSLDYAYPGFDRAVAPKLADGGQDILTNNLRPEDTEPVSAIRVGNNRFRIESVTRDGQTVTAILCNYRYGMALEQENGQFVSVSHKLVNDDGIDAMLLRLTAPPDGSNNPLPPQNGPAPAPSVDVFGDWRITGFLNGFFGPAPGYDSIWPTFDADTAKCVAEAPDPPERRAFLIQGEHPRSDFPTSPPSPGWPEGGSE